MDGGCPSQELYDAASKDTRPNEYVDLKENVEESKFRGKILGVPPHTDYAVAKDVVRRLFLEEDEAEHASSGCRCAPTKSREDTAPVTSPRHVLEYLMERARIPPRVLAEALGVSPQDMNSVMSGYARVEVVHAAGAEVLDRIRRSCDEVGDESGKSLDHILVGRDAIDQELSRLETAEQKYDHFVPNLRTSVFREGEHYEVCSVRPCTCLSGAHAHPLCMRCGGSGLARTPTGK